MKLNKISLSTSHLIIIVALFFMLFCNYAFFKNVMGVYSLSAKNIFFIGSVFVVFTGVIILALSLLCNRYTTKPLLIINLLITSVVSYFADTYNVIIDSDMLRNTFQTDVSEAGDLFSWRLVLYVVFLGVLPSVGVYLVKIKDVLWKQELFSRVKLFGSVVVIICFMGVFFGSNYASFFREHKQLRYYSNPGSYINATVKYSKSFIKASSVVLKEVGEDAQVPVTDVDKELVIFVVGEAARADRFSLNGYGRETNPLLKKEDVLSFNNFWSSGTCTAVSVPSMFSPIPADDYDFEKVRSTENALDVLKHAGISVLWRDNNSDSKGVALRVKYQDFKSEKVNKVCDIEARDIGMLDGLQEYIDAQPDGDIFIVLHQMGNHGPAYYKRYPSEFEKFSPVAKTNQLEDMTKQELDNAYDNGILYTDYFLSKVIGFLKKNDNNFETIMIYSSDHGESLGENGIYLHGMPKYIAPEAQVHVPTIFWFGKNYRDVNRARAQEICSNKYNHDYLFHTILGLMEVESDVYDPKLDLFRQ